MMHDAASGREGRQPIRVNPRKENGGALADLAVGNCIECQAKRC
jgi:hypothetical protein